MSEDAPGYGFVAPEVPGLGMGVAAAFRGRGVGEALLEALLGRARAEGFGALSLSVEDGNPAARLYERHGFERLLRVGDAWTMKAELARDRRPNTRSCEVPLPQGSSLAHCRQGSNERPRSKREE
jgi:RimJ/RimL family protein N-acetyltransferase